MKIAALDTIRISIPFHYGGEADALVRNLDMLLVKVETDAGITGWGEAFGYTAIPATQAALERMITPLVLDRDVTSIPALMEELQKTLHNFGRYGATMFALSGLDIALWDIAGKAAGLPLYRLFGGAAANDLPAYASLLPYGEPETVGARVSEAVAEGYTFVKLHERTVPAIKAAREAAPQAGLMVDVNCPWTAEEAIAMAAAFAPFGLHWLEEPVWPPEDFQGLAKVSRSTAVPIAAGENACTAWEFRAMLAAQGVAYAQPSVTKVGGVTEFRKVAALCDMNHVHLAPHSPYFGPGFLATLQLAAGTSALVERYFGRLEASLYGDLIETRNGRLQLPSAPGLGCEPDADVIRCYRVRT